MKVVKKIVDDLKQSTKEAHEESKAAFKEATKFKTHKERCAEIEAKTAELNPHKCKCQK